MNVLNVTDLCTLKWSGLGHGNFASKQNTWLEAESALPVPAAWWTEYGFPLPVTNRDILRKFKQNFKICH